MAASRLIRVAMIVFACTVGGCAHAPPVTGDRARGATPSFEYPDVNCEVNNTIDCRPSAGG